MSGRTQCTEFEDTVMFFVNSTADTHWKVEDSSQQILQKFTSIYTKKYKFPPVPIFDIYESGLQKVPH